MHRAEDEASCEVQRLTRSRSSSILRKISFREKASSRPRFLGEPSLRACQYIDRFMRERVRRDAPFATFEFLERILDNGGLDDSSSAPAFQDLQSWRDFQCWSRKHTCFVDLRFSIPSLVSGTTRSAINPRSRDMKPRYGASGGPRLNEASASESRKYKTLIRVLREPCGSQTYMWKG